jgi:uncharacterized SAM-binding protein YcdF (DUF218 family)
MHDLLSEVPGSVSYSALIPPALFILLAALGIVLAWRWRRVGLTLATVAILALYAVSTPAVAFLLIRSADRMTGTVPAARSAQPPGAIVVLAADARPTGDPRHPLTVGPLTLQRIFAAAQDARRLKLPVLVSGGPVGEHQPESLALLMAGALQQEFGIPVRWREERSTNTFQNALYSARILRQAGIGAAYVVTHRWHMARALYAFRRAGYPVVPLPFGKEPMHFAPEPDDLLPSMPALHESYFALHELIGLAWYRLRY